jgi:hypothetical protein
MLPNPHRLFRGLVAAFITSCAAFADITLFPTGTTEDRTTEIESKLAANANVYLSPGVYYHGGILNIRANQRLIGLGNSSDPANRALLRCSSDTTNAVKLTGTNPYLENVAITTSYSGPYPKDTSPQNPDPNRSRADKEALVFVENATNFTVKKVTAFAGRQDGIMVKGGGGSSTVQAQITGCNIYNTLADGIHCTNGAKWISIRDNIVTATGDDMIAVVSYLADAAGVRCSQILIENNQVYNNNHARGITVIGGDNVRIIRNTIRDVRSSGIQIASEAGTYNTYAVSDVRIEDNLIERANRKNQSGLGGVVITGRSGYVVNNIRLARNTIRSSNGPGVRIGEANLSASTLYASNVTLTDTIINGATNAGIQVHGAENVEITSTQVVANLKSVISNVAQQGLVATARNRGFLRITNTRFEQTNTAMSSSTKGLAAVQIDRPNAVTLSCTIQGNFLQEANPDRYQYYIYSAAPVATPSTLNQRNSGNPLRSNPTFLSP